MPKIQMTDLKDQVQRSLAKTKRNPDMIGIGTDEVPIPDFIPAPPPIQKLTGLEGYPLRRITMISGKPDSGKTTLAMLAIVEAQKKGCYTILVDTEKKFDYTRLEKMGGDPKELFKITSGTIEDGFTSLEATLNIIYAQDPSAKCFVVWDSIGGTPSKAEVEARADESTQLATAAKVIKRNLRVFVQRFDHQDIGLLLINQMYANIGSVGNVNSGGQGVDYYSALILQLSRTGHHIVTRGGEKYKAGVNTSATVTKNHVYQGERTIYKSDFRVLAYGIEDKSKSGSKIEGDTEEVGNPDLAFDGGGEK